MDSEVGREETPQSDDFLKTYQAAVRALTPEDVLKAVQAAWHPDRMTILAVGNYKEFDGDFSTFGAVNQVDITIANVAMPHMQGSTSASREQIAWVLTSYIVAAAICTPLVGWLAGRIGRRRLILTSIACFTGFAAFFCAAAGATVSAASAIAPQIPNAARPALLLWKSLVTDSPPYQRISAAEVTKMHHTFGVSKLRYHSCMM